MFYAGQTDSAVAMADLTQAAKQVLDEGTRAPRSPRPPSTGDPDEELRQERMVQALPHRPEAARVKPDTVSVHLYPWLKQGTGQRNPRPT